MAEGGPSDDFSDIRAYVKPHGKACAFTLLKQSDPELADRVKRAMDAGINARSVARWLESQGVTVGDDTLRHHYAGECCRGR